MNKHRIVKCLTGTMALAALLSGCAESDLAKDEKALADFDKETVATKGVLVVVQEIAKNDYKILDESPSSVTKIIIKHLDGTTEVLNDAQAKELFNKDKVAHAGNYSNVNSNFPIWWMLYNSNYGYSLGRISPPAPSFSNYYVHPATFQKAQYFAPNAAKTFTGSARAGVSQSMAKSIASSARGGFGGGVAHASGGA